MGDLTTEYAGHAIVYDENRDLWRCRSLDLEAKTLSALKTKVGKVVADARRISVPVLVKDGTYGTSFKEANVLMLDADGTSAWAAVEDYVTARGGWGRGTKQMTRRKFPIVNLVEITPETEARIAELKARAEEVREAQDRQRAADAAIPRLTVERLRELGAPSGEGEP